MALNGGDPDEISLKTFLDMSYAVLVDEYRTKGGMNLMAALEETQQYASGGEEKDTFSQVERKNADSLAQLDRMMRGVQK